jgi:two-component system sensor histidine kinase/response regulator
MSRARGGSGLGLSITRQLVELKGGKIAVESELGRGSRLTFTARLRQSMAADQEPYVLRHLPLPSRTLVADGNAVSGHVLSLYLAIWQIDATIVMTIDEVEAVYRGAAEAQHRFDVAILDVKGLGSRAVQLASGRRWPSPRNRRRQRLHHTRRRHAAVPRRARR